MSYSYTSTTTFTLTHARYLGSKIAADLRQLWLFYDNPDKAIIDKYAEEFAVLVSAGYLSSVEYGFKRDGKVIYSLRYTLASLSQDDRAGGVATNLDLSGTTFYSYLRYSSKWDALSSSQQAQVESSLPFKRTGAPEPSMGFGFWSEEKQYSAAGTGVGRKAFKTL
jgi:hypothetical protein